MSKNKITEEKFIEIFKGDSGEWDGDNAFIGLQILSNYTSGLIQGARNDVIWSESIDYLILQGITEDDVRKLRELNWFIQDGHLMCFV